MKIVAEQMGKLISSFIEPTSKLASTQANDSMSITLDEFVYTF